MSKLMPLLSLTMLLFLLTGCGPMYKTQYSYVPPQTPMGQMCISQCMQNKTSCEQLCHMRNENCRARARQDAFMQYEAYRNDMLAHGQAPTKSISDFDRGSFECSSYCNCMPAFHSCYAACGGQVLERQVCVAFCDKR